MLARLVPGWLCSDWWYPGHAVYVYCVQDWVMLPEQFPSGLVRPTFSAVLKSTQKPRVGW